MSDVEWRVIPSFPGYEINNESAIRARVNHKPVSTYISPGVGIKASLWDSNGSYLSRTILDLVRETFPETVKPTDDHFEIAKQKLIDAVTEELSMTPEVYVEIRSEYATIAKAVVDRIVKEGWHTDGQC